MMTSSATRGRRERVRLAVGGATRGSVVALPHRKQISALSAISVPQCVQIMSGLARGRDASGYDPQAPGRVQ